MGRAFHTQIATLAFATMGFCCQWQVCLFVSLHDKFVPRAVSKPISHSNRTGDLCWQTVEIEEEEELRWLRYRQPYLAVQEWPVPGSAVQCHRVIRRSEGTCANSHSMKYYQNYQTYTIPSDSRQLLSTSTLIPAISVFKLRARAAAHCHFRR